MGPVGDFLDFLNTKKKNSHPMALVVSSISQITCTFIVLLLFVCFFFRYCFFCSFDERF